MQAILCRVLLLVTIASPAGCITEWNTRLPQVQHAPPALEIRDFERNDPFADLDIGPKTFTRPRGFEQQRAMPRRMREQRELQAARHVEMQQQGVPSGPPPTRYLPPPTSWNYPAVVRP